MINYFYKDADLSDSEILVLLATLPTRVRIFIKTALVKVGSLTLGILKSLYPKAVLDIVTDGWATGTTEEKSHELTGSFRSFSIKLAAMIGTEPHYDVGL